MYGQRQGSTGSDPTPSPPSNENSHSPVDDDEDSCDETIYEEVSNLMDSPPSSGHEQMLADSRRRSASQDTLTGTDLGGHNALQPMSDDDGDSVDEDGISMSSEVSSSTFSSFTTSANQDFEFIVSQKSTAVASRNFDHEARESTAKQSAKGKTDSSSGADRKEPSGSSANDSDVEPSTLSMAAMYYNRFILNESGPSKATGHRQRPKVNRRQSFSTAYELRQRILVSQLNRERFEDETGMELIEEEEIEPSLVLANNGETLEELLSYKLNRRISTSEDNLLSIISTIANCGDTTGQEGSPSGERSPSKTPTPSSQSATSSSADSSPAKPGTFLKKDGPAPAVRKMLYTKKAPRAREQIPPQSPVTSHSSAIPRAASSSNPATGNVAPSPSKATIPGTANISIRELKSKKQATRRTPDGTPSHVRPKSALNVNADRICELGSLWNRTSTGPNSANSPKSTPTSKPGARYTATSKLLEAVTISTSSSSPTTPCRVPTFIPAPVAVRTPTRKDPAGGNFNSKLTPPSQYVVKVKQNARQNAILAKNALSADTDRDRCK